MLPMDSLLQGRTGSTDTPQPVTGMAQSQLLAAAASSSPDSQAKHLPALTSLRFFAAMVILIAQCGLVLRFVDFSWPVLQAISFFFVLSGFVLMYRYPAIQPIEVGRFYRCRVRGSGRCI